MRYATALLSTSILTAITPGQPSADGSPDDAIDYCAVASFGARVEFVRPGPDEPPLDDVNWFARPLPNERGDWIVGFASHNQNYLYNLTTGRKIKIPDRSDAVATPDGRYMTVPSSYTSLLYLQRHSQGQRHGETILSQGRRPERGARHVQPFR